MSKPSSIIAKTLTIALITILFCFPIIVDAQSDAFSIACDAESAVIVFFYQGTPIFRLNSAQITPPLSVARSSGRNQIVVSNDTISVWALHSNELQIHRNDDPDGTKYVVPAYICGEISLHVDEIPQNQALIFAQAGEGGEAVAIAHVMPNGEFILAASVIGPGVAYAFAENNAPLANYYVVRTGDNLFRIAIAHGTTVAELARINGISDPAHIWIGQRIYLP